MDRTHDRQMTSESSPLVSDYMRIDDLFTSHTVRDQSVAQHHNLLLYLSATFSLVIVYSRQAPV
jgi:hypothetical protein